jgi:hypothetical protein
MSIGKKANRFLRHHHDRAKERHEPGPIWKKKAKKRKCLISAGT